MRWKQRRQEQGGKAQFLEVYGTLDVENEGMHVLNFSTTTNGTLLSLII